MAAAQKFDVVVIGAGAAGLFCAAAAGRRGRRVLLLDHADAPGKKILISGGGRCNFTNLRVAPENFLSGNPHFCKSALAGFSSQDFVDRVRAQGIAFHEKHLGQLFCDGSAKEILAMLVGDAAEAGVDMRLAHRISGITKPDDFCIETDHGAFTAGALVLATGGLSIPKLGATGFTHEIARQFGLALTDIRPGLVPMTADVKTAAWISGLSGVAFEAAVTCGKAVFRDAALFTHRGLSGPAILQISSYWQPGDAINLDMLPGQDAFFRLLDRKAARPKAELKTVLSELLPARLAHAVLQPPLGNPIIGSMPNARLKDTAALIQCFVFEPAGTEGFAKAEVTAGGVDTRELSSKTMQALKVPGLYVIGEAVDVTGWLGGYNFQWAWSSGFAAGQAV